MNNKEKLISIASTIVVLLILYVIFEKDINDLLFPLNSCEDGSESCVRFCCGGNNCDKSEHFNISYFDEAENLSDNFSIVKGIPCDKYYNEDGNWSFYKVIYWNFFVLKFF